MAHRAILSKMADSPPATLRLQLERTALADNWRTLDTMSGAAVCGAAVKADAYGLGIDQVVPTLVAAGARDFFVAHWSEVAGVARYADSSAIAVLHGAGSEGEAAFARRIGALPVINSLYQARIWHESGGGHCHLMVDTGINRLGVPVADLGDPLIERLEVDMLMSHLASADENTASNAVQAGRLRTAMDCVRHRRSSLANSAGIALGPDFQFQVTRPGLSLYGGVPRGELAGRIRQVAFPQAAVIQLRTIGPGESVGYNATFTAKREMRIATLSIGYADGFLRSRGPGGQVFWQGEPLPVIGKVSMDMITVDASGHGKLREGDWLDIPFDLPEIAAQSGLSQYELLTTVGKRFDRTQQ